MLLRYHRVSKRFGAKVALQEASLGIPEGTVFGLLGANGAGKTTLVRLALDILRPDGGEIELFGKRPSRAATERVSYLPEERGLYRDTRVLDMLAYLAKLKGLGSKDAKARARRWLKRVGLEGQERKRIRSLSKGMAQKAQIASALMTDPELCIMDEPFTGLDPVNADIVRRLIVDRRGEGTTILSTHRLHLVEALCDHVAIIHQGRVVVSGTLDEVRRAHGPNEIVVRADDALPEVEGLRAQASNHEGTRLALDGIDAPEALARLVGAGARVRHFEERLPTMERIFIDLVGARVNDRGEQVGTNPEVLLPEAKEPAQPSEGASP